MKARYRLSQIFYSLVPAWLSRGPSPRGGGVTEAEGEALLWLINKLADGSVERTRQSVYLRFPSYAPKSSLPYHAQMRGLVQGRAELDSAFRKRLIKWRYPRGHRVRGSAWAWLEQLSLYWQSADGAQPEAYTIDVSGNRFHRAGITASEASAGTDPALTYTAGVAWDWDGAAPSPNWGRIWTVLVAPAGMTEHPTLDDPTLWGGLTLDEAGDAGYTVGQTLATPHDTQLIRDMLQGTNGRRSWARAGVREEWLVLSLTGETPEPDGAWDTNAGRLAAEVSGEFRFWPIHHWVPLDAPE